MTDFECGFPFERYPMVTLAHGGGGRLTQQLIDGICRPAFRSPLLEEQGDGAVLQVSEGKLAFSTDSYVVRPLFFPGGDIGKLAITGTCNDLAMCGARPRWISVGMILEEGLPTKTLTRIVKSMAEAATEIGVQVVAGDTKVVERGKGDGIYLNTSGVGVLESVKTLGARQIHPGDVILVSGAIGKHGVTVLSSRQGIEFESKIVSDCKHLWPEVFALFGAGIEVHALRDLTRGGLATALIELAQARDLEFCIREEAVPVDSSVRGACELLGLDPLFVANEGRMVIFVPRDHVSRALEILQARDPMVREIGEVLEQAKPRVRLVTRFGTNAWLEKQSGEQLPRIC